jgi:hypothetical protein
MTDSAAGKTFGLPNVKLPREVPIVKHRFTDYFIGFEKLPVVREIFGSETDRYLRRSRWNSPGDDSATWEQATKTAT